MIEAMAAAEGFKFTECLTGLYLSALRVPLYLIPYVLVEILALRFQIHWQYRPDSSRTGVRGSLWV
jgi:hypothetical protein